MRFGKGKLVLLLTLVGLVVASGCKDAVRDGILLGTSGGLNTAISRFVTELFAQVTDPLFADDEPDGAGGPP